MIVNGIDTKDISVVVQGAIDKDNTPKCLRSIREHLPDSEIILSTWKGSDVTGLDYDKLVLNDDPGGYKDKFCPYFCNNLARHILSTQSGLQRANGKYVLKIRSDLKFFSSNFLRCFTRLSERNKEYIFTTRKLIACSFFSKKYLSYNDIVHPAPFHLSDWLLFGLKEDVNIVYNIPLPDQSYWDYFSDHVYTGKKSNLFGCAHQYAPEQYILYNSIKKYFTDIKFENYMDYNECNIIASENIIANNFIILSPQKFKLVCLKKNTNNDFYYQWCRNPLKIPSGLYKGLYRDYIVEQDYKKYCQPNYKIRIRTKINNFWECILRKAIK